MNKLGLILFFFATLLAITAMTGCKGDVGELPTISKKPRLNIAVDLTNGSDILKLNDVFTDEKGYKVKIVAFKFYMSGITAISDAGNLVLSDMELFDLKPFDETISTPQWTSDYTYVLEEGTYDGIQFGIGVPSELNSIDPSTYQNNDPLSTYSNMYWSWASMYRFIILEAKVDTTGGDNFDHDVIFHTGLDALYRGNISFSNSFELKDSEEKTIALSVDWNDLFYHFNELDIHTESITHTTDNQTEFDIAERFTNNFVESISAN